MIMVEKAGDGAELRSSGHNEDLIRPESEARTGDRRGQSTSDTSLVTIRRRKGQHSTWLLIIPGE